MRDHEHREAERLLQLPDQLALEQADWNDSRQAGLADALGDLDDRSRSILERRWLTDDKSTLHELADEYGVSAERIRQIEAAAIGKLRTAMAA
jgi:RNA polymerase sigma-32 factor